MRCLVFKTTFIAAVKNTQYWVFCRTKYIFQTTNYYEILRSIPVNIRSEPCQESPLAFYDGGNPNHP
jgi:hypothetical protein